MRPRSLVPVLSLSVVFAGCAAKEGEVSTSTGTGTTDAGTSGSEATTGSTTDGDGDGDSGPTTSTTGGVSTGSSGATTASTSSDTTGDPPAALVCPTSIDAAILSCITALQADPELGENIFLLDMLWMCSDAEPVADDYDAHCGLDPADPICALEYAEFVAEVLPECVARAQEAVFAEVCLLPATYQELLFTPAIAWMQRRFVSAAEQLDAGEQAQVLWASADMGFPVATVAEALLATDDDGFEQLTVLDVGTDRTLVTFSAHYGDTRVGRMFFRGTTTLVGAVEDGQWTRCGVERTIEGQPCTDDLVCAPDHSCLDVLSDPNEVVLAPGACVSLAPIAGEGQPCSGHAACGPGSGLLCLDSLTDGVCRPGWMRHSFAGSDAALVAGGTLDLPILVSGLATVPTAAYLDLQVDQDGVNPLVITLVNPEGTSTPVMMSDAPTITLELAEVPVPGDESAGGVWHLRVEDIGGQASGAVAQLALMLDTRWD